MDFVGIRWIDASDATDAMGHSLTWMDRSEVEKFANDMTDVISWGYLLQETSEYYILAADDLLEDKVQQWGRVTKIPKGMVRDKFTVRIPVPLQSHPAPPAPSPTSPAS